MWVDTNEPLVARALVSSHAVQYRVEVWSTRLPQRRWATAAPYITGEVKDEWVSGNRRSIGLSVPPTADWLTWLSAGCEVRPYTGIDLGGGRIAWYPHGRFPVQKTVRSVATSAVAISADDKWSRIVDDSLLYPRRATHGIIQAIVTNLLLDVDPTRVIDTTSNWMTAPQVVWDKSRAETIADLVKIIGAEVFYDRVGSPNLRRRPGMGAVVRTFSAGWGGNLLSYTETVDLTTVINAVGVYSTATDTRLLPVTLRITDISDPAHWTKVGGERTARYSSSAFKTKAQMVDAGNVLLRRGAAPARQWTFSILPDPSLDASDTVLLKVPGEDDEHAQIQTVTHPLNAGDDQTVTTVSTRPEDVPDA